MSIERIVRTLSGACTIGLLLSACNGASVAPVQAPLSADPQSVASAAKPQVLAVGGYVGSTPYVTLYNDKYQATQTLTYDLIQPFSLWFDNKENLYVADINRGGCNAVFEFAPGGTTPIFAYTGESCAPFDVKTDKNQNVYVANNWGNAVIEYPQQINTPIQYCNPLVSPSAVAIDSSNGNVFLAYYNTAPIAEFAGGLSGCYYTNLSPSGTLGSIGNITGMLVDKKGNLLAVDGSHATVDVIPPPYSSISAYIGSGVFKTPNQLALNKNQNLLYVADSGLGEVLVLKYPKGKVVHTITSGGVTSVAAYPSLQE